MSELAAGDAEPQSRRTLVLYVDDNAQNVQLVEHILREVPNLRFASASTGEYGLQLACELSPSLILLDLGLPDLDGEAVLQRVRAHQLTREIPVVIISG